LLDIVVEEGLRTRAEFFADASDAQHVRCPIVDDGCIRAADQMIPVALPSLRIDGLGVRIEAFASGRRRFEEPADAEDVARTDLDIAAPEVVCRAHAEGADHVARQRRSRGREALLPGDVFMVALDGEVEMRTVPQDGSAD